MPCPRTQHHFSPDENADENGIAQSRIERSTTEQRQTHAAADRPPTASRSQTFPLADNGTPLPVIPGPSPGAGTEGLTHQASSPEKRHTRHKTLGRPPLSPRVSDAPQCRHWGCVWGSCGDRCIRAHTHTLTCSCASAHQFTYACAHTHAHAQSPCHSEVWGDYLEDVRHGGFSRVCLALGGDKRAGPTIHAVCSKIGRAHV